MKKILKKKKIHGHREKIFEKKKKFTDIFRKLSRIVFRPINFNKIIREKKFEKKKKLRLP